MSVNRVVDLARIGIKHVGVAEWFGQVGCNAASLTTLFTYPLPAGGLAFDRDSLEFEAAGVFAGTAGTELFVFLGGSGIFDSGEITPGNESYVLRGRVMRTGPTSAVCYASLISATLQLSKLSVFTGTQDFSAVQDLAVKGLAVNANDIYLNAAVIDFRGPA